MVEMEHIEEGEVVLVRVKAKDNCSIRRQC